MFVLTIQLLLILILRTLHHAIIHGSHYQITSNLFRCFPYVLINAYLEHFS